MSIRSVTESQPSTSAAAGQPAVQPIETAQAAIAAIGATLAQPDRDELWSLYIPRAIVHPLSLRNITEELIRLNAPAELIREVTYEAVKQNGRALQYADPSLKGDYSIVLEAVKQNGEALQYADPSLKENHDIVWEAVQQNGWALEYTSPELRADHGIVLAAVKNNGEALAFANYDLRNNPEIASAAYAQNKQSLKYAQFDAVLAIVQRDGLALQHVRSNTILGDLRNNRDIVHAAYQQNPSSLRFAGRDAVLAIVQWDGDALALRFASELQRNDPEIARAAIRRNPKAFQYVGAQLKDYPAFITSRFNHSSCLPTPAKFRSKGLPKLPSDCGLDAVNDAVDALSWSNLTTTRDRLIAAIKTSYAGQLLEKLQITPMTQAEFEAKTPEDRSALCNKFLAVSAYYARGGSLDDASYAAYSHYCDKVNENVKKLRNQLTSCRGELGQPNPVTNPAGFKAWLKQVLKDLTYIEKYIREKETSVDAEFMRLQVSTCTDACASRTQAVLSRLSEATYGDVLSGEEHEMIFLRHLKKVHDTAKAQVLISLTGQSTVHSGNQVNGVLSRYGFIPQVEDALPSYSSQSIVDSFKRCYNKDLLVSGICEELNTTPSARRSLADEVIQLSAEELAQIEGQVAEGTLREAITQREDFGARFLTDACKPEEKALIPKELQTEALRTAYQHAYPGAEASAAADVPSFEEFARARRQAALPGLLRRVALDDLCSDKIEEIQLRRYPLNDIGRVKPEAVMSWLLKQGFFG